MSDPTQDNPKLFTAEGLTIVNSEASCDAATPNRFAIALTIPRPVPHPPKNARILFLPDELLLAIIKLALYRPNSYLEPDCGGCTTIVDSLVVDKEDARALSLACLKTKRIAQPLLFRDIRFRFLEEVVPPTRSVLNLHRTLQENAELRQHCKALHIHIPDFKEKDISSYKVVMDFADWLPRIRCLTIHGGFQEPNIHTWALIDRFVTKYEHVEHVEFTRDEGGLSLAPIIMRLKFPKLRKLGIFGISQGRESKPLEIQDLRTSTLTSISLAGCEEDSENLRILLLWPAALTHFSFGSLNNNPHLMDYPLFEKFLLPHAHTLTYLSIGSLSSKGSKRIFNATLFPVLETLQLSRWQMPTSVHFQTEDADVLGRSLKTFIWNFILYGQPSEGWTAFGKNEAEWIEALGHAALTRKAPLKTIKIQFSPDHWGSKEEMGYPWDWMDDVRDRVLQPNGVDLVYTKPSISKEEWLRYVRE